MKKSISMIIAFIMIVSVFSVCSKAANRHFTGEVGVVRTVTASPVVNGIIRTNEGWSDPVKIDKSNYDALLLHSDFGFSAEVYFSSDKDGFYFAADIKDDFTLHTLNEEQDENGNYYYPYDFVVHNKTVEADLETYQLGKEYGFDDSGFNGDTFTLQLDPLGWFYKNDYRNINTAYYNVAILNGEVTLNRTKVNEGRVNGALAAGARTGDGWKFEAFLPWSEIAKDCAAASGGEFKPSALQLSNAARGIVIKGDTIDKMRPGNTWTFAEIIYTDRIVSELDTKEVWQRYVTVSNEAKENATSADEKMSVGSAGICLQLRSELSGTSDVGEMIDVDKNAWYFDAVDYVLANGLFSGVGNGRFDPDGKMTRAMIVTVLYNQSGKEAAYGGSVFSDVSNSAWYAKAVKWASVNGIVSGIGGGKFDPDGLLTREQTAQIFYRYAAYQGRDTTLRANLGGFRDAGKVSSWAREAVSYAVACGLISGNGYGLDPQGSTTRAQAASILMRYDLNG